MKKVLILTVTAGNGHNSAAMAVKEECEKLGANVLMIDLLHEFCDKRFFIWIQEKGYPLVCQYLQRTYNMFFKHFQKANPKKFYKSPVQNGLLKMYDKLLKLIYEFQPDTIYASHFLPCVMITNLRKLYSLPAKTFSFVFDYAVCPFWEAGTGIDFLLVPNENFVDIMVSKGFKKEQLLPYGLTVNEKFSKFIDKMQARKILGLNPDKFTIFVMFGGGFWSGNFRIVKNLFDHLKNENIQIVVANGKNEKDKRKIDHLKVPHNIEIFNFGFCKNIDVVMSAADILVGKAGGVSVTESLNKILPMVCSTKLPEQERVNVSMLVKEGAAKQYKSDNNLIEILSTLIESPAELEKMKNNIKRIRKPFATKKLAETMMGIETVYTDIAVEYSNVNKQVKKLLKNAGGGLCKSHFSIPHNNCQFHIFRYIFDS